MAGYRLRAKNKGQEFTLTFVEFKTLIQLDCFYCGEPPRNLYKGKFGFRLYYQGLDRVINSQGYTPGNVAPCCGKCNQMKSDTLTAQEMLAAMCAIKKLRK